MGFTVLQNARLQTYLARKFAEKLSRDLKTHVSIGKLRITPILGIVLEDLLIQDKTGDPFVSVSHLNVRLGGLKPARQIVYLSNLTLDSADIRIVKHKGDSLLNYHIITDYFAGTPDPADTLAAKPWHIYCTNLIMTGGHVIYRDENEPPDNDGMDYSFIEAGDINTRIQNIEFEGDTIDFKIKKMSATEKGGMQINNFTGAFRLSPKYLKATSVKAVSPLADIDMDFTFNTHDYPDWEEFIDSVYIRAEVRHARINLTQFLPFTSSVSGMDNWIEFEGKAKGTVSDISGHAIKLWFGKKSLFEGDVKLTGLPDIEETYMNIKVNNFTTTIADVESVAIGVNESVSNYLVLPRTLERLEFLRIKGDFTGFYNDFVANASFITGIGDIVTDLSLKQVPGNDYAYSGHIATSGFYLGKLFELPDVIGKISLDVSAKGQGFDLNSAVSQINGTISEITLNGYNYHQTKLNIELGEKLINGNLTVNDTNLYLGIDGTIDLNDSIPDYNFVSEIKHANLQKLNLLNRNDSNLSLSAGIRANFQASGIDNMIGMINISNLAYTENLKTYKINKIILSTTALKDGNKSVNLISDFVDVDIRGLVYFDRISESIELFIRNYLYSFKLKNDLVTEDLSGQNFSYNIYIKNIDALSKLFFPWIRPSHNSRFQGFLDSKNRQFRIEGDCDTLFVEDTKLVKWRLNGQTLNNLISLHTGCERLILNESFPGDTAAFGVDSLFFVSNILNDSIFFKTGWNEQGASIRNMADINGFISFTDTSATEIKVASGYITVNDSTWDFTSNNSIKIDKVGYHFFNTGLASKNQKIVLNGDISADSTNTLAISFENFKLQNLNYLLANTGMSVSGLINGDVRISNIFAQTIANSGLTIKDAIFNDQKFGDISVKSDWDPKNKAVYIDALAKLKGKKSEYNPFAITGYYYPNDKKNNFDLSINLQNIGISSFSAFTKDIISDLSGYVSGDFKLTGTNKKPNLDGTLKCIRTEFRVDYLNTIYSFTDDIKINNNQFLIENLEINDSLGNKAYCNGKITHNYLKSFAMDVHLKTDNFNLLNTNASQNSYFYGNALGSGIVHAHGPLENIVLDAQITARYGTELFVPLNTTIDIQENTFVTFIKSGADGTSRQKTLTNLDMQGFSLNFDLAFNPDARLNIELPSQSGTIVSKGEGNIKIGINSKGDFGITGGYSINNGTFIFRIKNVLNRVLEIQKGSTIRFDGNPYDAEINMSAFYISKTTLKGLDLNLDSTQANSRIPVKSIIRLKNKLINPDIKFSILFPKIGEDVKQIIYTKLDTTNDMIMTQQFISLLAIGSFSFTSNYASLSSSIGSSSFQLISNQINNLLSQISKDFDIGINYRPGDAISTQELEVALKTQLFDDRVTIDGNLGVSSYEAGNKTSNIVGDVLVEVNISDDGRFKIKAFNRSNNIDLQKVAAPYTQGIGVFFRKEFNNWGDLFRKKKKSPPPDYEVKL
jgi:hypothetical protein